jgi:hypothetical protein
LAWTRTDVGAWRPIALGTSGRTPLITLIPPAQEDELRAFCNLVARRAPRAGEVAWALRRFGMGCERADPMEGLSDHLLALRALLEPEGPGSGLLPDRLAALCAVAERRALLAEHVAHAVTVEQAYVAGLGLPEPDPGALCAAVQGHLRAVLRDVLCGHLDSDLRAVADGILAPAGVAGGL